jgi:glucose-6-phosphate isomerase
MSHSPLTYTAFLGALDHDVDVIQRQIAHGIADLEQKHQGAPIAFRQVIIDSEYQEAIIAKADHYRTWVKTVVLIGIGGSDLGVRALLKTQRSTLRDDSEIAFFAVGDTSDPTVLHELRAVVSDWNTTLVIISSKSGNTIEQMASFLIIRGWLIDALGDQEYNKHIIAITDPKTGTLRTLVEQEGYDSLPVPSNLGGRYSVFSAVGIFPLALCGIDVRSLIQGAQDADHAFAVDAEHSIPAHMARNQILAYQAGMNILVFMSYAHRLREIGFWFRQLWAESLGKKHNLDGQVVNIGPTPIAAVGPTDQHSQLQLYMEGPHDKFVTVIGVHALPLGDITVPSQVPDLEGTQYLSSVSLMVILDAERTATTQSLAAAGRPSAELLLQDLTEYTLGYYLQTLMLATITAAGHWKIDPYDQPGVEIGKQMMFKALGRPGY